MTSACPYRVELPEVMTNFDHSIDEDVAAQLKEREAFAQYAGWNFNALVWWDRTGGCWVTEVSVHHVPRQVLRAPTLRELHDLVCNEYGWD